MASNIQSLAGFYSKNVKAAKAPSVINSYLKAGINWVPTLGMWGAVAAVTLVFAVQPTQIYKHLPLTKKD